MINFFFEDCESTSFRDENQLLKTPQVVEREGFKLGFLNIIFCSDRYLLLLNKQHLNHDYFTDIITFPFVDEKIISGDLFISLDRVSENAETQKVSKQKELARVVIHGILHLCGYNDKQEEEVAMMRSKEKEYLNLIGFT